MVGRDKIEGTKKKFKKLDNGQIKSNRKKTGDKRCINKEVSKQCCNNKSAQKIIPVGKAMTFGIKAKDMRKKINEDKDTRAS